MKFELTHVRHDPATCLAPGLFRSLKRGERKNRKLDVTYVYGKDSVRFWGPEPLGVDDLRVLQGLIAMAAISGDGGRGIMLRPKPMSEVGEELRTRLELKWDAIEQDALVVKGSIYELAREMGYAGGGGGSQFQTIRTSIERLWAVSVIVEREGWRQGFRILADYASDAKDEQIFVALNPRLAEAVVGRRHARIDMAEVRALRSDPARLVHQRLCGWIDPGKSGRVTLDTLCDYVWPEGAAPEALKKRRQTARKVLAELVAVGWTASEYAKEKWEIKRSETKRESPAFRSPKPAFHSPSPA